MDALHPGGFTVIGGLTHPAAHVRRQSQTGHRGNRWHSHASIPKTIIDLLALPALGVPRVDTAPSLADRVDPTLTRPQPPAYGTVISQPAPPTPTPAPVTPDPWPGPLAQPMPDQVTLDGSVLPAPADAVVHATPPKPPKPPTPTPPQPPPTPTPPPGPPGPTPPPTPPPPPGPGPAANLDALVDKAYAGKTPAELAAAPLAALKGLSPTKATALGQALDVTTIGDLAANKLIQAATTIAAADGG